MFYVWFHVLGVDPEAHNWWDVLCWARSSRAHEYLMFLLSKNLWNIWMFIFVLSENLWSTWVFIFVLSEILLNTWVMKTLVLIMKLLSTWKYKLEVLGISPWAFQVDVEHNLGSIGSLAIVSLGVSYKHILGIVLSDELQNGTNFVTPCS